MRFGIHLPLMEWDGTRFSAEHITAVATAAEAGGFDTLAANDHFVFRRAWLDGPSALAAALSSAPEARLMTSVALPVVRGPVALAKTLASIDLMSGGRVVAGVGPGSTPLDYDAVGISFDERWPRFEEAVRAMRALWDPDGEPFEGRYYATTDVRLEPPPVRPGGPPIWIGSWGSEAGLRRVARLADGWLASAYNTTPERFGEARSSLADMVSASGRDIGTLPNSLGTMWLDLTDSDTARRDVLAELATLLRREPEDLDGLLPIGPSGLCSHAP